VLQFTHPQENSLDRPIGVGTSVVQRVLAADARALTPSAAPWRPGRSLRFLNGPSRPRRGPLARRHPERFSLRACRGQARRRTQRVRCIRARRGAFKCGGVASGQSDREIPRQRFCEKVSLVRRNSPAAAIPNAGYRGPLMRVFSPTFCQRRADPLYRLPNRKTRNCQTTHGPCSRKPHS
jgi:hypothetical protein